MLEPGVLRTFRLAIGIQCLISFANVLIGVQVRPHARLFSGVHGILLAVLFLGLQSSWIHKHMGRIYLPFMLTLTVLEPTVARFGLELVEELRIINTFPRDRVIAQIGTSAITLFIPLLITAWQYNLREVTFLSGSVSILFLITYQIFEPNRLDTNLLLQVVLFQFVSYMILGSTVTHLMAEQRQQRKRLAQTNQQLAHYAAVMEQLAITRERNRLARELHDTLAHTQSGVIVQMEGIDALWENNPERAHIMFRQSLEAMRMGLGETRRALEALRATPLEDMGLKLAITEFAESLAVRNQLDVKLEFPSDFPAFEPEVEHTIYRFIQEGLTNVVRHAHAKQIIISLIQHQDQVNIAIFDDGQGFLPESVNSRHNFGLRGMQERAEQIGGILTIQSKLGQGTTIQLGLRV